QTHEFLIACGLWLKAIVQAVAQADDQADIQAEEQQISGGKIPGVCWACKWAMGKLKKHLGTKENDAIKAKLLKVCSGIGLLKKRCENFINKNIDVLTEELSTSDDPKTICTNIGGETPTTASPSFSRSPTDALNCMNDDNIIILTYMAFK
ncbi:antimicrobial peptide NK-lysin-like, partial [Astyanax mexicanus]